MTKRVSGYVYVLGADHTLDLVRVGSTVRNPWLRAHDLKYGNPTGYMVLAYVPVSEHLTRVENTTHDLLRAFAQGNDWYLCKPDVAYRAIQEAQHKVNAGHIPRVPKR